MRSTSLSEYFFYTRSERNAGLILSFLSIACFIVPTTFPTFFSNTEEPDFSLFQKKVALVTSPSDDEKEPKDYVATRSADVISKPIELFPFNPNTASKSDLERLGISSRTAQTIINYRSKGGKFFKKEDLQKIYGLRAEDYQQLESFISIPSKSYPIADQESSSETNYDDTPVEQDPPIEAVPIPMKKAPPKMANIDVNQATVEEWQQLYGIGPGYSKRIVKFRDKLGGFHSVEQVSSTYGLPDSTFQKIKPHLKLSPIFRKLRVNSATKDELKAHPYLSNFQATVLFNYRKQHGAFSNLESMKNMKAGFKEEDWTRLNPYLSFE